MGTKFHRRIQKEWKVKIEYSESVEEGDKPGGVNTEIIDIKPYLENFAIVNDYEEKNNWYILSIVMDFIKKHKNTIKALVALIGFIGSAITIYQFIS